MADKRRLFTYVEVDDKTPIQKLAVKDQLRVLLKRLTYDEANELKGEDAVTLNNMKLKANLMDFVQQATQKIREGQHHRVTMAISNTFDPVFDEVIHSSFIEAFYDVTVDRPNIEYDIPYFITVDMEVKTN